MADEVWPLPCAFGRYQLEKCLGQGAMGVVYLALDTQLNRHVALKVPQARLLEHPLALERFHREARMTATVRHPHVCQVFDVGECRGQQYLTMEFVAGTTLEAWLGKARRPAARPVAALIRKIALALHAAHLQGVVHRDLKPANIMLDVRGEPKVMDFGLARHFHSDEEGRLTQHGAIVGTPAYMAPEQVRGNFAEIGPATDIYALGVILYQLLTGELPFAGQVSMVYLQILNDAPRPLSQVRPEVDPMLAEICDQMMAKDPGQRFASMRAVAAALADYLRAKQPVEQSTANSPSCTEFDFLESRSLRELPASARYSRLPRTKTGHTGVWVGCGLACLGSLLAMLLFARRDTSAQVSRQPTPTTPTCQTAGKCHAQQMLSANHPAAIGCDESSVVAMASPFPTVSPDDIKDEKDGKGSPGAAGPLSEESLPEDNVSLRPTDANRAGRGVSGIASKSSAGEALLPDREESANHDEQPAPSAQPPAVTEVSRHQRDIDKALADYEAARHTAAERLVAACDREIEAVRRQSGFSSEERQQTIAALIKERETFESHGTIPFSPRLRTAANGYIAALEKARKRAAGVYNRVISDLTRSKSDDAAARRADEKRRWTGPVVIGVWECRPGALQGTIDRLTLYSDHTVRTTSLYGREVLSDVVNRRWRFSSDRLYLEPTDNAEPDPLHICVIDASGQTFTGLDVAEDGRGRVRGRRVAPAFVQPPHEDFAAERDVD